MVIALPYITSSNPKKGFNMQHQSQSILSVPQWQFFGEQVLFPGESQRCWALSEEAGGEDLTRRADKCRTIVGQ